jgi:hypothetical protein
LISSDRKEVIIMNIKEYYGYRQGYVNGIQDCKNDIRKQIVELIDNHFINSLEDVIKYLESKGM